MMPNRMVSAKPSRMSHTTTRTAVLRAPVSRPKPALNAAGCRDWDGEVEEEADWLAGILLVPDDAAVALARNHYSDADAAKRYGVSEPLMRWRLNVSGARLRAKRTAAKYARLTGRR